MIGCLSWFDAVPPDPDLMADVENYRQVIRQLKDAEREIRLGVRKEIRQAAEPVRGTAETFAVERIRSIGPRWSRMRVGVTQRGVYVAPRQRSTKVGSRKRPNLSGLLLNRAMEPALNRHQAGVVRDVERVISREAAEFNRKP